MIKKGEFVRIKKVVLEKENRSNRLPECTTNTPLIMWTKGYLQEDGKMGDNVKIETLAGRIVEGELVAVNHSHNVNYGGFVKEILKIGKDVKGELFGE